MSISKVDNYNSLTLGSALVDQQCPRYKLQQHMGRNQINTFNNYAMFKSSHILANFFLRTNTWTLTQVLLYQYPDSEEH